MDEERFAGPSPTTEVQLKPEVDQARLQFALEQLRSQQNLFGGVLAGAVAALVGAAVWAAVTVFTGYQIGWLAVGVGFLVGFAVRTVGKGVDKVFGIAGAVLALLGCLAGNLLAVCGMIARQESMDLLTVLSRLDAGVAFELLQATFSPIDLLFYGFAVWEGYRFSIRQLTEKDLGETLPG